MFFYVAIKGLSEPLVYQVGEVGLQPEQLPGCFAKVPLRNRLVTGFIVEPAPKPDFAAKSVLYPPLKIFNSKSVDLIKELTQIYPVDLFTVASTLAPPILEWQGLSALKKIFTRNKDQVRSFNEVMCEFILPRLTQTESHLPPKRLTKQQEDVFVRCIESADRAILIHGETGSGKTELYIHLALHSLEQDLGVLILVPEISLTPQMIQRFSTHIPSDKLAILHSGLTRAERAFQWMSVVAGFKTVVIGTRSAVLAPVRNLRWIIVDEEHDRNFRHSESAFRYDAVRISRLRSEVENCRVILGSATPRLETYHQSLSGDIRKFYLPPYSCAQSCLQVEVVNVLRAARASRNITQSAALAIKSALDKGKQAIIFYNRVGYCGSLYCPYCGKINECPNCALAFRVIKAKSIQYCSVCGHSDPISTVCATCSRPMVFLGAGTERIFEEAAQLFPNFTLERLDKETHPNSSDVFRTLERFGKGEINLLISTQMITKGHDFKNLAVVVAANPDIGRNIPDFRQLEHSYQLLHQLAGRLGRSGEPGRLIIQTRFPDDPVFDLIRKRDFETFAKLELANRQKHKYPPFASMLRILCTSDSSVEEALEYLKKIRVSIGKRGLICEILGPSECYFNKLKKAFRAHMLLKFSTEEAMIQTIHFIKDLDRSKRLIFDIDPIELT